MSNDMRSKYSVMAVLSGRVQIFENNFNKSKFYSEGNYEQIEVRECLLSFGAECFVLQFAILKLKIKIYSNLILLLFCMGVILGHSH
jgi:hypothetical protein